MPIYGQWTTKPPPGTSLNPSHPLANQFRQMFIFNEGNAGSIINKVSGNISTGAANVLPTIVAGINGSTVHFGSSNNELIFANDLYTSSYFSLLFSVNLDSSAGYATLRGTGSNGLYINSLKMDFYSGGDHTTTTSFATGTWNAGAVTYDNTNFRFYINGILDATVSGAGQNITAAGQHIGWDGANSGLLGALDYLYLLDGVLDANSVASIAANPWQVFAPPTVWWLYHGAAASPPVVVQPPCTVLQAIKRASYY